MKNFTKKRGFFVAAAALLVVTTMLVTTWCSNDIGTTFTDEFTPPPGKGAVMLSFNNKVARTILPKDVTDITDFDEFELQFRLGGVLKYDLEHLDQTTLYTAKVLDPGTYDLTVIAYVSDGGSGMLEAATNAIPVSVTIEPGKIKRTNVELKVLTPAAGKTGTFAYKLTGGLIASDFATGDTANMTLTPVGAIGTGQGPIDIKSKFGVASDTTITVDTGIYYVDFVLKLAGDTVTFRHIAHIYENMTSSYTFTITFNYFNAVFKLESGDITFDLADSEFEIEYQINAGTQTPYSGIVPVTRGQTIKFIVVNASEFTNYEWYCVGTSDIGDGTATCTITTATGTYSVAKNYTLTVIGVKDSQEYSANIEFKVQ